MPHKLSAQLEGQKGRKQFIYNLQEEKIEKVLYRKRRIHDKNAVSCHSQDA